jgi:hypothetical protein
MGNKGIRGFVRAVLSLLLGGTGANLSSTGPGVVKQPSQGAALSVASLLTSDLPASGVTAASYGTGAAGTISITVNAQGQVTAATAYAISVDASAVGGQLAVANGGTGSDLSATGPGFLKQTGVGSRVFVAGLASSDIPNLDASKITTGQLACARGGTGLDTSAAANGKLLIGNGSGLTLATLTQGTGITLTNGAGSITVAGAVFVASGASHAAGQVPDPGSSAGTTHYLREDATWTTAVSSVGLSLPAIFTVSNSPVTTSGTLTATLATQAAGTVWAGPVSGTAAAPTFRSLVPTDESGATRKLLWNRFT